MLGWACLGHSSLGTCESNCFSESSMGINTLFCSISGGFFHFFPLEPWTYDLEQGL